MFALLLAVGLFTVAAAATDPYCPAYPPDARARWKEAEARLRAFRSYSAAHVHAQVRGKVVLANMPNLIDQYIFGKMQADGVAPAPQSGDSEFLRRVYLDLTGRLPTVQQAQDFLNSTDPGKRPALVEQLLASPAYIDKWTLFYGNLFQVTSGYYNLISIQSRNLFNQYLREFVSSDRSWADVAREILTASGDSYQTGPPNYMVRGIQQGDPIQDTWDTLTDQNTVAFLGLKTLCVSCHDGRGHLEQINLFLAPKKRTDFWGMSAFLSRMGMDQVPIDDYFQRYHVILMDASSGGYPAWVDPNNPGPRPARYGGPYSPVFMLTGETPATGQYRSELARMITSNRQFARAAVNYIWAAMFTQGIVDPPGQWDIMRIDPNNPPPAPWTIQPTHPELINALADEFVSSNYSIKHMIRLMANSQAYQLSSQYGGTWNPVYDQYFARHIARRLAAEEVYDAVAQATMTAYPMEVEGYSAPINYAGQLPDPTEPRNDGTVQNFLNTFGRGDWWNNPRNSTSTIIQALFMMNDNSVNFRTFTGKPNRVVWLLSQNLSDTDAINNMFLAALSRYPTAAEMQAINQDRTGTRDQWFTDIQWALLNKLDFLFNH
ncbi:MAG TPA: DUF1553 domain-containing protein [Bryobacteraceae bacterium]|jgi:hypothetical protein|nr:DUF1553 domain-containing protein [Bryobacteraceae bacterium]